MNQVSIARRPNGERELLEDEHRVIRLLKWLPAGPVEFDDANDNNERRTLERKRTLVQFVARHGGIRTIAVDDLIVL